MDSLEKKKPNAIEQNGDEMKPLTKKQERNIKMKRYAKVVLFCKLSVYKKEMKRAVFPRR